MRVQGFIPYKGWNMTCHSNFIHFSHLKSLKSSIGINWSSSSYGADDQIHSFWHSCVWTQCHNLPRSGHPSRNKEQVWLVLKFTLEKPSSLSKEHEDSLGLWLIESKQRWMSSGTMFFGQMIKIKHGSGGGHKMGTLHSLIQLWTPLYTKMICLITKAWPKLRSLSCCRRKHSRKSITEWLKNKGIKVLQWLSQSPHLNLIQMLWWDFQQRCECLQISMNWSNTLTL